MDTHIRCELVTAVGMGGEEIQMFRPDTSIHEQMTPEEYREFESNHEEIAPFHLRDQNGEDIDGYSEYFASFEVALACAERAISTGKAEEVHIYNAFSNVVGTVGEEDVIEGEDDDSLYYDEMYGEAMWDEGD